MRAAAERVRVAFITIDPERDTPAQVAKYVKLFDKRFIGLAGARLEAVLLRLGGLGVCCQAPLFDLIINL